MVLSPIILSLKIAALSTIITLIIGIFLARVMTKYEFWAREILECFIIMPMVIPPSVMGYGLLVFIGNNGVLGKFLNEYFGVSIVFT